MMSKPAVQNVTAAVSQRILGSSEPVTAIQAAAGAMPSEKPRTRCEKRGEALGVGVEEDHGQRHRRQLEAQRIQRARGQQEHQNRQPSRSPRRSAALKSPAGMWRMRVRGLRASISASRIRLNAIAAERAPTIATTIQSSFWPNTARVQVTRPERQQRARERERQREHGVLELDHLQRQPQPLPKSHLSFPAIRYHSNSCALSYSLDSWCWQAAGPSRTPPEDFNTRPVTLAGRPGDPRRDHDRPDAICCAE